MAEPLDFAKIYINRREALENEAYRRDVLGEQRRHAQELEQQARADLEQRKAVMAQAAKQWADQFAQTQRISDEEAARQAFGLQVTGRAKPGAEMVPTPQAVAGAPGLPITPGIPQEALAQGVPEVGITTPSAPPIENIFGVTPSQQIVAPGATKFGTDFLLPTSAEEQARFAGTLKGVEDRLSRESRNKAIDALINLNPNLDKRAQVKLRVWGATGSMADVPETDLKDMLHDAVTTMFYNKDASPDELRRAKGVYEAIKEVLSPSYARMMSPYEPNRRKAFLQQKASQYLMSAAQALKVKNPKIDLNALTPAQYNEIYSTAVNSAVQSKDPDAVGALQSLKPVTDNPAAVGAKGKVNILQDLILKGGFTAPEE